MKNIIIFCVLIVLLSGCSTYPPPSPRYSINKEISIPGVDANTIFDKTEMWISRTFVDSRSVLELKNREGKMLYANTILTSRNVSVKNTLEMYIKDDVIKVQLSNINVIDSKGNIIFFYENKNLNKKFKESFENKIQSLFVDLETFIKTPTW
jgi:hypothetical protein